MTSMIEKAVASFESLPENKRGRFEECIAAMDRDFVFNVAKTEGEGLDTLHQVGLAIEHYRQSGLQGALISTGYDKIKLASSINLYRALCLVKKWCTDSAVRSIDSSSILMLHKVLGEGTKDEIDAGEFRRGVAWTISTDGKKHVYLDFKKISPALEQLLASNNKLLADIYGLSSKAGRVSRILELAASFFFKFESIHPFRDGNGRVGRLLVAYLLSDVMPWGAPNNLYVQGDVKKDPVFADRMIYLKCFQTLQEQEEHRNSTSSSKRGSGKKQQQQEQKHVPSDLEQLLSEGVRVGWLRYKGKFSNS